jgi:tRNA G18 (ribose-2'-O)-methylase SpoU
MSKNTITQGAVDFFSKNTAPFPKHAFEVLCVDFASAENIGQVIRLASNMAISSVYYSGKRQYKQSKIHRCASSAFNHVETKNVELEAFFLQNKKPLIAIETAKNAKNLFADKIPSSGIIMLGNERYGLSDKAIEKADYSFYIPVPGITSSLNVSHSLAIFLWEWYRKNCF